MVGVARSSLHEDSESELWAPAEEELTARKQRDQCDIVTRKQPRRDSAVTLADFVFVS
jgi:hypothetical protein